MRVKISGERTLIDALSAEFEDQKDASVVETQSAKDDTELAFGVVEAALIVGIVANSAQIVDLLLKIKDRLGRDNTPETTPVKVATAKDEVTVELHPEITEDELSRELEPVV